MTYIDSLPKELRNELEFYKNFAYRMILNILSNRTHIYVHENDLSDGIESRYMKDQLEIYNKTPMKVVAKTEELDVDSTFRPQWTHIYYYEIPMTQLCTLDIFLKYLNGQYCSSSLIDEINEMLENFKCYERIAKNTIRLSDNSLFRGIVAL